MDPASAQRGGPPLSLLFCGAMHHAASVRQGGGLGRGGLRDTLVPLESGESGQRGATGPWSTVGACALASNRGAGHSGRRARGGRCAAREGPRGSGVGEFTSAELSLSLYFLVAREHSAQPSWPSVSSDRRLCRRGCRCGGPRQLSQRQARHPCSAHGCGPLEGGGGSCGRAVGRVGLARGHPW